MSATVFSGGIIDGIICDGKVNEKEVYHLKAWMDDYGDLIKGHKPGEALCKMMENILADGIVTEGEQLELLHMISIRISGSQFETKLEYLCKQVRIREEIGIDLIDILDNENALNEIHELAEIYDTTQQNISQHIEGIYQDKELDKEATDKKFLLVRNEGTRQVKRNIDHYNLDIMTSSINSNRFSTVIIYHLCLQGPTEKTKYF